MGLILVYPIYRCLLLLMGGDWLGMLGLAGCAGLVAFVCKTTFYIISGEQLIVKSMGIVHEKIDIKAIRKIEKTNNPLSAPALSLDRIAVKYNRYDEVYLSPKARLEFVGQLKAVNPGIEVVLNK